MIRRIGIFLALFGLIGGSAAAVEPCPAQRPCAAVEIEDPVAPVEVGDTAVVRVVFLQGPGDASPGGLDEIAGVGLTLAIPGLELADCADPGSDGLNPSFTLLPSAAGRYRLLVQNLVCDDTNSCLCPDDGETRDAHINLLLVGTPGGGGVQPLPNGALASIALRVRPEATGTLPLHVFSAIDGAGDPPLPSGGARLSVGDREAVDRTVDQEADTLNVRIGSGEIHVVAATPTRVATATATATATQPVVVPTATAPATATATSSVALPTVTATAGVPCVGDCNDSGEITVNELIAGVGITLGSLPLSACEAFDCDGTGQVGVACLIAGVNAALDGCPE
jgi:hypothetical protein